MTTAGYGANFFQARMQTASVCRVMKAGPKLLETWRVQATVSRVRFLAWNSGVGCAGET